MSKIFLDSFSGAVADLSRKEQSDPLKVLVVLAKDPMISTWDMSESSNLRASLRFLLDEEMIEEIKQPFPWHRFELTGKGKLENKDE